MHLSSPFLAYPRDPVTTWMLKVFMPHILAISISRSLTVFFSTSFAETFHSDGTVTLIR